MITVYQIFVISRKVSHKFKQILTTKSHNQSLSIMKIILRYFGRFLLFSVFIAQAAVFAHYASYYLENNLYYLIVLLVVPAMMICGHVMYFRTKQLNWQWLVWLVYVIFLLIPMACLLLRSEFTERLDKRNFFGPNVLKIAMCGAPAIALLLLTTAKDSQCYEGSVAQLCGSIALDLFDELELLEMLLNKDEGLHLSTSLQTSIIAFVCVSFFLTALEMGENEFDSHEMKRPGTAFYVFRLSFQLLFVNVPLLVIRLFVWFNYEHDASIFTAKNAIIIVTSLMEIIRITLHS